VSIIKTYHHKLLTPWTFPVYQVYGLRTTVSCESNINDNEERIVACPADAKVCSDGSTVSRTGANCEFEACPSAEAKIAKDSGNKVANDKKQGSKIESVDNLWNRYTNYDLGFTIKFPKKTNWGGANHKPEIIEDGEIVYITSSDIQKNEVLKIKESNKSIFEKANGVSFAILVQKASGEKDLDKFIKNRYDTTCNFDGIKETKQKGVFEVLFSGDAGGEDNFGPPTNCFINYTTVVRYSPSKELVAAWDIGQAINFDDGDILKDYPAGVGLDMIISDSFEFLK